LTPAAVAALKDTDRGMSVALANQYGRLEEAGSHSVMTLDIDPFLTIATLLGLLQLNR
jgi:hypothetical protein